MKIPEDWCVLFPLYQGGESALEFFSDGHDFDLERCFIINDGSTDGVPEKLRELGFTVLDLPQNQGKSKALEFGFQHALQLGFLWALSMDADGQHSLADIPYFCEVWNKMQSKESLGIILGRRNFAQNMPWPRVCSNTMTSALLSFLSGCSIKDSQCGYRLYRLGALRNLGVQSRGFQWESEVLVSLAWAGWEIAHAPIQTIYGDEISTIHPIRDTWRFIVLYFRLWRIRLIR